MASNTRDTDRGGAGGALRSAAQWLTDAGIGAALAAARAMPYERRVPFMGRLVARVASPLAGFPRRIRANLAHVWPDLPEAEVARLVDAVPDNFGRTMIELFSGEEFRARALRAPISGEGLSLLDAAADRSRPVIIVSGHYGNYDVGRVIALARGLDLGGLYRPMRNPWFNRRYVAAISTIGTPLFEQSRRGMAEMMRHLRRGGSLAILTDLNAWGGAPLDFLGRPALTSTVIPELALRHDVPILPLFATRQENGLDFDVTVEAPITPASPEEMAQEINDRLAAHVRRHPEQWFWIHRRWKVRKAT